MRARLGGVAAEVARPRERNGDVGEDAPRPLRHHDDAVAEQHGLVDVVRHEHHRAPVGRPDAEQLALHVPPRLRVERAERLVHQQQRRVHDHRAAYSESLPHSDGQLVRIVVGERREAHALEVRHRARAALVRAPPPRA